MEQSMQIGTENRCDSSARAGEKSPSTRSRDTLILLKNLMAFLFPPDLQHPLSLGRLYAFGMRVVLLFDPALRGGNVQSFLLRVRPEQDCTGRWMTKTN